MFSTPDMDDAADPLLSPADKMKRTYNFVTEKKRFLVRVSEARLEGQTPSLIVTQELLVNMEANQTWKI